MFFFSNHETLVEMKDAKNKTEDAEAEMMACNDTVHANRSGNEKVRSRWKRKGAIEMETKRCYQVETKTRRRVAVTPCAAPADSRRTSLRLPSGAAFVGQRCVPAYMS